MKALPTKNAVLGVCSRFWIFTGIILLLGFTPNRLFAQANLNPPVPIGLNGTPDLTEGAGIIKNKLWAIRLGKALFWDQQAGSDGNSCASCHFNAGADTRITNQMNPGFNDITQGPKGDANFGSVRSDTGEFLPGQMPSGAWAGPNYTLQAADMPLHRLQDEADRNSPIRTTTNDRVSSQGAFDQIFSAIRILGQPDACTDPNSAIFHAGTAAARQVEPRNTPSTINAVFNHRNFWDGRANNMFNGVGPFGMRDILGDPNKRLLIFDANGNAQPAYLQLANASLASQAVAPVVSPVEMSCNGRSFADVGRKLLLTIPLLRQNVDSTDSVLGSLRSPLGNGFGLKYSYAYMIQQAFDPKWWSGTGRYSINNGNWNKDTHGHTQMELNFSMIWGIAIMLYESTLVSNQTEYDSLISSGALTLQTGDCLAPDSTKVDPLLARGCFLFFHRNPRGQLGQGGGCSTCHGAPLLSEAAFQAGQPYVPFLQANDVKGILGTHDLGFINIGLRPFYDDQMEGRTDPYGNPLSLLRQYNQYAAGGKDQSKLLDPFLQQAVANYVPGTSETLIIPRRGVLTFTQFPNYDSEVDGATKVPMLRNVALTPPYFSWGGYPNLRQVMKVYNRGMNRRDITPANSALEAQGSNCTSGDDTGSGPGGNPLGQQPAWPINAADCGTNVTGALQPLGLLDCDPSGQPNPNCLPQGKDVTNDDLAALVRFMKSLTDSRVQCDKAPFDHPSLTVTNGHEPESEDGSGLAEDITFKLPAVGAAGYSPQSGYCIANSGDLFAPGMQARSGGLRVPLQ